MTLKKIVLVGANGTLGPFILNALLSAQCFDVTILSRATSKSIYPSSVHIVAISNDPPTEELVQALRGQDAIVVAFSGAIFDLQLRLADAAVLAGVKRFIPADYGSCDSSSPRALSLMPLYVTKQKVRQYLQKLAAENSLTWTSIVNGHFFDYGLASRLLAFDIIEKRATIFDGGEIRWSATTLNTIGLAVARVLQKEKETSNRMLYIQSFCISQNELLESVEKVAGKGWQIKNVASEEYIKNLKAETDRDPSNSEALEDLVGIIGMLDANWESKNDFANELLGLEAEDLDQVVHTVVTAVNSSK
jgi:nucleoside-diphosphate-sugar epimerase